MFENKSKIENRKSKIRFGVIGCGWVARDYGIPAILAAENAELAAICDLNFGNLRAIEPDNEAVLRATEIDEFLNLENLDAVYIATPNNSHRFLTEKAARRGKHVLCEKPMAISYEDARRMVEVCAENEVIYATAFDQRFHARHVKLRELIAENVLGEITSVRIHYACWLPADWCADNWRVDAQIAGGGAFIDLAPHGIDLAQILTGENLTDFRCFFQTKIHNYAVDDGAVGIGIFSGGALFSINVAYNCPDEFPRRTLEILGTKALAISINTMGQTPGGTLEIIERNGKRTEILIDETADVSPFQRQIETFAECVMEEKPFPFSPEGDLRTMRIIFDAMKDFAADEKSLAKNV